MIAKVNRAITPERKRWHLKSNLAFLSLNPDLVYKFHMICLIELKINEDGSTDGQNVMPPRSSDWGGRGG